MDWDWDWIGIGLGLDWDLDWIGIVDNVANTKKPGPMIGAWLFAGHNLVGYISCWRVITNVDTLLYQHSYLLECRYRFSVAACEPSASPGQLSTDPL